MYTKNESLKYKYLQTILTLNTLLYEQTLSIYRAPDKRG